MLIQSRKFHLPGKKMLLEYAQIEIVLVDVTESPIERQKKSIKNAVSGNIKVQADSGYQGILKLHKNSETPKKKPRGGK